MSARIDQNSYAAVVSALVQNTFSPNQQAPALSSSLRVLLLVFGNAVTVGGIILHFSL